ncbi:uncharacterized protein [Phaseolus vulgaris]|uniref:uncharacterized protein n=1 Tax=Phaseolus vulgaris TaxID=3885 RepID=UPI0035CC302E
MAEDFPAIISKAVESSTRKLQDDLFALRTENSTIRLEAEKLSCNLTLAEIEHSRVEDAMMADLEALIKADAAKVKKLEQRSADREVFLGTVEKERDDTMAKLAEANKEKGKIAAELGQVQEESKKVAEDLLQAQETIEKLKKQAEELEQQNEGLKQQTEELKKQIEELNLNKILGKDRMAKLRAIAKSHKLAAGSQTIPNSFAEIAAAQGQSPPAGPPAVAALPAPQRKKLPLKKAKWKAPRVVSDEEADESTEDGLVCKRKRMAVIKPPAIESATPNFIENPPNASTPFESAGDALVSNASVAEAAPEQLADTHASSQAAEELPASPPRLEAPPAIQPCEGGGEHQPPPPPATSSLPAPL